jgi:integrase
MSNARKRRERGEGSYRQRGDSWELKFPATDPATGQRKLRYVTFKGTKTQAIAKLRELTKDAADGAYKAPTRSTFADVLDSWDKTLNVSPKTAERYRELVRLHIRPRLGAVKLQNIRPSLIEGFYVELLNGERPDGSKVRPLAPRTIGHIHRLLVKVLSTAERDGIIPTNPARKAVRPKIERTEIEILTEQQARDVLTKLRGRPMFLIAAVGLATGMRRGEILALRWRDVNLDAAELQVNQSLEETAEGLRFKAPKTKRGRRTISLPAFIVAELRTHKAAQNAQRLALGLGKGGDDALVICKVDGEPLSPDNISSDWRRHVRTLKLPAVSLHALRHTHASQLIASGMDVLTISRRLGHGAPSITLDVYSHLFKPTDRGAAAIFDQAFGSL